MEVINGNLYFKINFQLNIRSDFFSIQQVYYKIQMCNLAFFLGLIPKMQEEKIMN